ncbi:MAG: hypothetical protein DWI21_19150 [Planctomycetota bacterium]|nr:MAG: hypothetical protein DWI21_19150 [Planctomycetota bacterium]
MPDQTATTAEANPSDDTQNGDHSRHSGCANPPVNGGTCRSNSAAAPSRWQARNPGWTMKLPG